MPVILCQGPRPGKGLPARNPPLPRADLRICLERERISEILRMATGNAEQQGK